VSRGFDEEYDYGVLLAAGKIAGQEGVNVAGHYASVGTTEITLWELGVDYTDHYLTANAVLWASSTNASDTNVDVVVIGCTREFNLVVAFASLNGQNQVELSEIFYRVFTVSTYGSVAALGDVYIAESDTLSAGVPNTTIKIKARMNQGTELTSMGLYTQLAGATGSVMAMRSNCAKADDFKVTIRAREDGGTWKELTPFHVFQNSFEYILKYSGTSINAGQDIEQRVNSSLPNTDISVELDGVSIND